MHKFEQCIAPGGPLKCVAGEAVKGPNCMSVTSEDHVAVRLCRLVDWQMQVIPSWSPDLRPMHAA